MKVAMDDLRIAADKTENYGDRIESIQEMLHQEVERLLGAPACGHTRTLLAAFTRFDTTFSHIRDSLDDLHRQLLTAAPGVCERRFDREAL
ncbi:hypothetical protein AADG42_03355 [Ammonicoccus fulvus]|uniref:Uncharacterized protein n=1 Tax=Ammonicoccus fulvus TaxID=3138240 RepID=A0ABZ3FK25_9ACTN